jgi:hypothetical protein
MGGETPRPIYGGRQARDNKIYFNLSLLTVLFREEVFIVFAGKSNPIGLWMAIPI